MSYPELQGLNFFTSSIIIHLTLSFLLHLGNKKLLCHLNIQYTYHKFKILESQHNKAIPCIVQKITSAWPGKYTYTK